MHANPRKLRKPRIPMCTFFPLVYKMAIFRKNHLYSLTPKQPQKVTMTFENSSIMFNTVSLLSPYSSSNLLQGQVLGRQLLQLQLPDEGYLMLHEFAKFKLDDCSSVNGYC
jgi:hypothetical protein